MTTTKYTYRVNDVYKSIQGEGHRAGTENIFIRFTGCNMRCELEPGPKSPGGFDCDTEFESGRTLSIKELREWVESCQAKPNNYYTRCNWLILTGGEPALQVDAHFIRCFHLFSFNIAIETNGSIELPDGIDFVAVSPKVAEHCIRQTIANEVRYVRGYGQAIPKTVVSAPHKYISPAFSGDQLDQQTLEWCNQLVEENPEWTLSEQTHKFFNIK